MHVLLNIKESGIRIKKLRTENGLKVSDFARKLNVCEQTVYHWESGRTLPKIDQICAIAALFNKTPNDIIIYDTYDNAS